MGGERSSVGTDSSVPPLGSSWREYVYASPAFEQLRANIHRSAVTKESRLTVAGKVLGRSVVFGPRLCRLASPGDVAGGGRSAPLSMCRREGGTFFRKMRRGDQRKGEQRVDSGSGDARVNVHTGDCLIEGHLHLGYKTRSRT
jgi:hypothetical protein